MLAKNIIVGSFYRAIVSGEATVVQVLDKLEDKQGWTVLNTKTNRKIRFRSAAKFKNPCVDPSGATSLKKGTSKVEVVPKSVSVEEKKVQPESKPLSGKLSDRLKREKQTTGIDDSKYAFPPTDEQRAILEMALAAERGGSRVVIVGAGAGTGKTSTDVMLAQTLKGIGQYTAFNANLVNEGKPKFASTSCACNTTHSLAFRTVGKDYAHRLGGKRVKAYQVAHMLGIKDDYLIQLDVEGKELKRISPKVQASLVMGAIRKFCQSADREVLPRHFSYVDGLDTPIDGRKTYDNNNALRDHLLPYAIKAWEDLQSKEGQLPFAHDHYVKIWQLNDPVIAADFILLDECQDTAPVMMDIIEQQIKPERKVKPLVILVGDSAQQIYEWRGAIDALAAFPNAPRKYLSQSFRFGEAIAQVANLILSDLREPTELRLKGLPSIPSRIAPLTDPTCVLCRTNAAAISTLLSAINRGKKPFLVGGGSDVVSFVRAALDLQEGRSTEHPELACFDSWDEVVEYSESEDGEDLALMVKLITEFGAKVIIDALNGMVKEEHADLVISTAHKSKGREWATVKLAPDFPPRAKCGDPDLKLLYVACTRAKLQLDVSECAFFAGEGGMSVDHIVRNQPKAEEVAGLIAAAEEEAKIKAAENPKPALTQPLPQKAAQPTFTKNNNEFTWSRLQEGGWGIRGPKGFSDKTVTVIRKDGTTSQVVLKQSVWEDAEVSLYKI